MTTQEIAQRYELHKKTIYMMAKGYARKYWGSTDDARQEALYEALAEANKAFTEACHTYEQKCAEGEPPCAFGTWLHNALRWAFIETSKQHKKHYFTQLGQDEAEKLIENRFELELTLMEVSSDARYVMELVLQPPIDVRAGMRLRMRAGDRTLRREIIRYLDAKGWREWRIQKAFREAQEALYEAAHDARSA